ncbi:MULTISPECIES: TonB-dependent receptor [Reichenbachiella]|uniref:TonB-linked outer membrane protein, SusC/RagA family n=1 Tax=Reichenbachiella agariperforans TaxID=156994 RepID=A0A1M6UHL6_REIAG|nr:MULTISPECIES: TonB-dependent receptor [Reichenbachiella]SHK68568.1 TonB-linked outer membrane protein, SusC/RagA family [Reichenbachiella agariperforans]
MKLKLLTEIVRTIITMTKYMSFGLLVNCFLLTFLSAKDTSGQPMALEEVLLDLELRDADLVDFFEEANKQSPFTFSYFEKEIESKKIGNVSFKETSMEEALREVSRRANVQFRRVNDAIYVSRKKSSMSAVIDEQNSSELQDVTVSGQVLDEMGEGLPGASVLIKGTSKGTTTDINGQFSLVTPEDAVLIVSFLGYLTQEITLAGRSELNVQMELNAEQLDELVVVGYGTQKKEDMTGSVGLVEGDDIAKFPTVNAQQAIQGRMAGVRVETQGGSPGANAIVTIRGSGTLSDNGPLYVIDGMLTGSMSSLNPSDIKSVTVLKDASASAIYGSRAANGVIIVTTKKGRSGEVGIEIDASYGIQKAVKTLDWANARQYADIRNTAIDNDNARSADVPGFVPTPYSSANDSMFDPSIDSDIQGESLRTAPMSNLNMRIFGGSDNATYSISGNHMKQDGIVKESSYERFNIRANSTFTRGKFKFEETIGITRTINNPNNYFNKERDLIPTVPMYDADGNFTAERTDGADIGIGNITNSLGLASLEDRTVTRNTLIGNVAGSYEFIEGLTYRLNVGIEAYADNNYTFTPTFRFNDTELGFKQFAELKEQNTNYLSSLIENTLTYKKNIGKSEFEVLAGYSNQNGNQRMLGVVARDFPNNEIRVASAAADRAEMPSYDNTWGLISYFGRLNYVYDSRYMVTASIRRDASSFFKNHPWGTFPSFAVGWNLSNERFMESVNFVSNVKLRASYGEIGSNNAVPYVADPVYNVHSSYITGSDQSRQPGYANTQATNELLTWETSVITDVGLEFSVLRDKLSITMDYFNKESRDVIADYEPSPWTGKSGTVKRNMATIVNQGFEFMANYAEQVGDFNFNVNANFTYLDNEVTALGLSGPIPGGGYTSNGGSASLTDVGQPIGAFYGLKVVGIYQTDEAAVADNRPNAGAGDFIFEDVDGVPGITDEDRQYLGSPIPNFEYGINLSADYKGFDLTLFFNGVSGNKILDGTRYRGFFDTEGNYLAEATDGWSPTNTDSDLPRNSLIDPANNRQMSDFYLSSGAYFRLRNAQIGYALPTAWVNKLGVSKVRIYGTAQNLFTLTKYTGYYPEVGRGGRDRNSSSQKIFNAGVDESAYPTPRTFMMGVQVSF